MRTLFLLLIASLTCVGAEDPWSQVRALKSGTEIRIFKRGARQPILAKADDATGDKLVVVLKNEQVAIAKDDIDRIDARPAQAGRRVVKQTRDTTGIRSEPANAAHPREPDVPTSSSSTNYTIGGKPDFETIYRRMPERTPDQK